MIAMDLWIDRAIDQVLAPRVPVTATIIAARLAWLAASLAVIFTSIFLLASLIGGLS